MSESITILLPCAEQKREFLVAAIDSVRDQTSPHWQLLVGVDPRPPRVVLDVLATVDDPRVRMVVAKRAGFASALNAMLDEATSSFVSILLSDDRYTPDAVETLLRYRERYPDADFLHSARRYIDPAGQPMGEIHECRTSFDIDHFKRDGSPVKHLLCWRRELGASIGGMNEELSLHGCDDYDFPWRMAEAGAVFQPVEECLYEYRFHDEAPRLTTSTPIQVQVETLEKMFYAHGATQEETCAYLQRSLDSYLARAFVARRSDDPRPAPPVICLREADATAGRRFQERGFAARRFFPHQLYVVRRPGPDGMKLAQRMCGVNDGDALQQALLYAMPEAAAEFPRDLFFDEDVVWHRQHLGRPGLVANANLVAVGDRLDVPHLASDLVQRISRRREHKTRIENRFKGWADLLVNAVMIHARDAGFAEVRFPTAALAIAHTDQDRAVEPELFERVYDRTVNARLAARRVDDWWVAVVSANLDNIVDLDRKISLHREEKTICLMHDVERGIGHRDVEPRFAADADRRAPRALERMLEIEAAAGVRVTYNLLGTLFDELRGRIESGGHALAFHSYQHAVPRPPSRWGRLVRRLRRRGGNGADPIRDARDGVDFRELLLCRGVDYRLRGYRPPQSRITPGLHDRHLAYFNFDWLASSGYSFGFDQPRIENGIVKLPVHLDDFDLHRGELDYAQWERRLFDLVDANDFAVIGLHDCYADHWIDHYAGLIEKLRTRGRIRTLDEVADEAILTSARWR